MIKIEHTLTASPEQMEFIIEGMRNPLNSWHMSDSEIRHDVNSYETFFELGDKDLSLMYTLAMSGTDHRKFMRMMPIYVRITAPLYWWKEFDTYKVGTVTNSCSTMHKITSKEFTLEDFSTDKMTDMSIEFTRSMADELNALRDVYLSWDKINDETKKRLGFSDKKDVWWQMIQLLPSSYNQTRNVMMNYEVACNIYYARRYHKLDEWHVLCDWIENLPYSGIIVGIKSDIEIGSNGE